jgi:ubiquinone/menaquinone biosynthesis C-methylase UbiE
MDSQINHKNELKVAAAFNSQSAIFDKLYSDNTIIHYKRSRVREHLLEYLKPNSKILELNAGTGDDAIYLAQFGHFIHTTDISVGMQEKLVEKTALHNAGSSVTTELCSYTDLKKLKDEGPYDCIFSNFAGLNCTGDLDLVLSEFSRLLKTGGIAVLVMLPKFCLWESLLMVKGKFKTATRRFFSKNGRKANIDGISFTCWYYSPGYLKRQLRDKFNLVEIEGLCTIVPPSYIEKFPEKYPKLYSYLCRAEYKLKNTWPWKYIGDYFIVTLRKK